MKWILALFVTLMAASGGVVIQNARIQNATTVGAGGGGSGGGNIVADFWQTFELNADCTASELDKSDGVAGANWDTTVDSQAKLNCHDTAASKAPLSTINSSADSGTHGLSVDLSGSAAARIVFFSPAMHDNASVGFWFHTPSGFGNGDIMNMFIMRDYSASYTATLYWGALDGNATRSFDWSTGGSGRIATSANTWYWVTLQYVRNATCSLSIYDASGNQVGASSTHASFGDFQIGNWDWGSISATTVAGATVMYDNLVINWTTAPFPLGP